MATSSLFAVEEGSITRSASIRAVMDAIEEFNTLYLGEHATAPTTDNDGGTLVVGALYFDSTMDLMQVWTGTVWEAFTSGSGGSGSSYASRSSLVAAVAGALVLPNGAITYAAGIPYQWSSGATTISDLPGLIPSGTPSLAHYGAVADGVTDASVAIQAAIDYLPSTGGTVLIPDGVFAINTTIVVSKPNTFIQGVGGANRHNSTPFLVNYGSCLKWTGAASGTMVRYTSISGSSNRKMTGGGISRLALDGADVAGRCLQIVSWNSGLFEDLMLYAATVSCLDFDVVAALEDARDPQENILDRLWISSLTASADGIRMSSTTPGANPSYNTLSGAVIFVKDGIGVNLYDCDNNYFNHYRVFVTGTGKAVVFNGSNSNDTYVPRDNVFYHLTTTSSIIARGTTSFTYASGRNACLHLDQTNNTSVPTVETGARLSYTFVDGASYLTPQIKSISAQNEAGSNAAYDEYLGGSLVSHIIVNDSSGHILLRNTSRSVAWIISADQTTGSVNFNIASGGTGAAINFSRPIRPAVTTVAGLSAYPGAAGQIIFASDATKPNSAVAGGFYGHDGTSWFPIDTDAGGGGGGSISDGDKGDITVSGTGTVWTLDGGTVTLTKMANLAANSIIGNNTGSAATPIALTASQVKTLLAIVATDITNSTAAGRSMLTAASATAQTALLDVATTSLKGLLSSTDKTKLDAITGVNTGDEDGGSILAKIAASPGAGGIINYVRADGSFADPLSGGGGGSGPSLGLIITMQSSSFSY